jgi:ComF family protein
MTFLKDFLYLIYPEVCHVCGSSLFRGEKLICMRCYRHLPRTNFYKDKNNDAARVFWGRIPVNFVYAAFYYNKGNAVQQLIHALKYKGIKKVGHFFGEEMGNEILTISCMNKPDLILPVPLHPRKLKKRGFNQSEVIAKSVAEKLEVPVNTAIIFRKAHTSTQTKKSKFDRWQNVENIFDVQQAETIEGKHLLLVDDVITTGSTLEACATALMKINGVQVSLAAGGFTK